MVFIISRTSRQRPETQKIPLRKGTRSPLQCSRICHQRSCDGRRILERSNIIATGTEQHTHEHHSPIIDSPIAQSI